MPTVCPWPIASARASARRRPRRRSSSSATQLATSVTTKEASGRATTCGHCWTRSNRSLGPISLWSSSTSVPKCLRTPPLAPSYPTPSTSTPPYLILKLRAQPSSINRLSRARALRWRFWVQPYDPSYHTALTLGESVGSAILLGSPWEYDVPQCGQGVPGCSWECGTVSPGCTWVHTVTGSHMGQHTFVAFNPQCV
jgi:hypothetical protein